MWKEFWRQTMVVKLKTLCCGIAVALLSLLVVLKVFAGNATDCAFGVRSLVTAVRNDTVPVAALATSGTMSLNLLRHARNEGQLLASVNPDTGEVLAPGYKPSISEAALQQVVASGTETVVDSGADSCAKAFDK